MNQMRLRSKILHTLAYLISKDEVLIEDEIFQTIQKQFAQALLQHKKTEDDDSNLVLQFECPESSDIKRIKVELKPTAYGELKTVSENQWTKINRSDFANIITRNAYLVSDQQFNEIWCMDGYDLKQLLQSADCSYMVRQASQKSLKDLI